MPVLKFFKFSFLNRINKSMNQVKYLVLLSLVFLGTESFAGKCESALSSAQGSNDSRSDGPLAGFGSGPCVLITSPPRVRSAAPVGLVNRVEGDDDRDLIRRPQVLPHSSRPGVELVAGAGSLFLGGGGASRALVSPSPGSAFDPVSRAEAGGGRPDVTPRKIPKEWGSSGQRSYNYTRLIDFNEGDLLYGLQSGGREVTLEKLRLEPGMSRRALTIDIFNKFIWFNLGRSDRALDQTDEEIDKKWAQGVADGSLDPADSGRFKAYYKEVLEIARSSRSEEDFYRASCAHAFLVYQKWGLKVHFILDDLDLSQVLDPSSKNYESYTNHELRSLRDMALENPRILEAVILYQNHRRLDLAEAAGFLTGLR